MAAFETGNKEHWCEQRKEDENGQQKSKCSFSVHVNVILYVTSFSVHGYGMSVQSLCFKPRENYWYVTCAHPKRPVDDILTTSNNSLKQQILLGAFYFSFALRDLSFPSISCQGR